MTDSDTEVAPARTQMRGPRADRLAEIALWLLAAPTAAITARALGAMIELLREAQPTHLEILVVAPTLLIASMSLGWHLLSLIAAHLAGLRLLPSAPRRRLTGLVTRLGTGQARRALARRAATIAAGAGLLSGTLVPLANASTSTGDDIPDDLVWSATATVSTAGPPTEARPPAPPARSSATSSSLLTIPTDSDPVNGSTVDRAPGIPLSRVVEAGDNLWAIATEILGPGSDPARIDALWRDLHDLNRTAIGDDPDLIHPGTVLEIPRSPR